jgi:hypothetical protein
MTGKGQGTKLQESRGLDDGSSPPLATNQVEEKLWVSNPTGILKLSALKRLKTGKHTLSTIPPACHPNPSEIGEYRASKPTLKAPGIS